jgi:hypothetical protein
MNLTPLIFAVAGVGGAVGWYRGYTYGNWGGDNWSGGQPVGDEELVNRNVGATTPLDGLFKVHDLAYEDNRLDRLAEIIDAAEEAARNHLADLALLQGVQAFDPNSLDPELRQAAALAKAAATAAFKAKTWFNGASNGNGNLEVPSLMDLEGWTGPFGDAEDTPAPPSSPLVLDLNGDGTQSVNVIAGAYFDHNADGFAEATGWASPEDGLLVWDRDANGTIDSGRELFGNQTLLQSEQLAANGFAALAEWDGNSDGKIDASDSIWGSLRIWQDADGDGFSAADELLTMAQAGVLSIDLGYSAGSGPDANGNSEWLEGTFTRTDSTTGAMTDYLFEVDTVRTIPEEWVEVSAAIQALPDTAGFGTVYDLHQAMARDTSGGLQDLVEDFAGATSAAERDALIDQIVLRWTGADGVDPSTRGSFVDARHLVALEAFMGRDFVGIGGPNPNANAAPLLDNAYSQLSSMVFGELSAQTHLKPLFDLITYSWDSNEEALVGDLGTGDAVCALYYERSTLTHGHGNCTGHPHRRVGARGAPGARLVVAHGGSATRGIGALSGRVRARQGDGEAGQGGAGAAGAGAGTVGRDKAARGAARRGARPPLAPARGGDRAWRSRHVALRLGSAWRRDPGQRSGFPDRT